jgi:hypothetical protein
MKHNIPIHSESWMVRFLKFARLVLFLPIMLSCYNIAEAGEYDGTWLAFTSDHWATGNQCYTDGEDSTEIFALLQNGNNLSITDSEGTFSGSFVNGVYTEPVEVSNYNGGTLTENFSFTLTSSSSGSGTPSWTWVGENTCQGGEILTLRKVELLTVTTQGTGSGLVTFSSGGDDCGDDCQGFSPGTTVTLTAVAATDSLFESWTGACTGSADCTLTMNMAKNVSALFTYNSSVITGMQSPAYRLTSGAFIPGAVSTNSTQYMLTAQLSFGKKITTNSSNYNFESGVVFTLDFDGDGVDDTDDSFPEDPTEQIDTDQDRIGNNADLDDDGDEMPDSWEISQGLDPLDSQDAISDLDNDGYGNLIEYRFNSDPNSTVDIPQLSNTIDIDGDGDTDINDAIMILRKVMNLPDSILSHGIVLPVVEGGQGDGGERSNSQISEAIRVLMQEDE